MLRIRAMMKSIVGSGRVKLAERPSAIAQTDSSSPEMTRMNHGMEEGTTVPAVGNARSPAVQRRLCFGLPA